MSWPDQSPVMSPPPQPQPPSFTPPAPATRASGQGAAVASLVLGIIAILLILPLLRPLVVVVGLGCAIAGIICGHVAAGRQPAHRGLAVAGLVLSYVALALGVVHLVGLFLLGVAIRHRLR